MPYRVIAIDPGDETGWATGNLDKDASTLNGIDYGHMPWKEFGYWLWRRQTGPSPFDIVVYESWRLRADKAQHLLGSDIPSIQCVGQIKAAVWWGPANTSLITSEPSNKSVINKQLAKLGREDLLGQPSLGDRGRPVIHHQDALRHLWHFAINKYGVTP